MTSPSRTRQSPPVFGVANSMPPASQADRPHRMRRNARLRLEGNSVEGKSQIGRQIGQGEVKSLTDLRQVSRSREQLPLELGEKSFPLHFLDQCRAVHVKELRGLAGHAVGLA